MKVTVWTKWNSNQSNYNLAKPKCIFIGDIDFIPPIGSYITVKGDFAGELVDSLHFNLIENSLEIRVATPDINNEYGDCLFKQEAKCPPTMK